MKEGKVIQPKDCIPKDGGIIQQLDQYRLVCP